ncbi:MAG: hypothetical protein RR945_00395 [Erysipelotrichaceae bacterium]
MAERRMFAKTIIDSDAFLEMPQSSQLLYFHLCMRADDEGFINNAKSIMRNVGCKDDDMNVLISRKFAIYFESGIIAIKHWYIHNYLQKDRVKPTKYIEEKAMLKLDVNKSYTLCIHDVHKLDTSENMPISRENLQSIQNGYSLDTQVRLDKTRLDKISLVEGSIEEISLENTSEEKQLILSPNTTIENFIENKTSRPLNQIDKAIIWSCKSIINDNEVLKLAAEIALNKGMEISSMQEILTTWVNLNLTSVVEITSFYKNNAIDE